MVGERLVGCRWIEGEGIEGADLLHAGVELLRWTTPIPGFECAASALEGENLQCKAGGVGLGGGSYWLHEILHSKGRATAGAAKNHAGLTGAIPGRKGIPRGRRRVDIGGVAADRTWRLNREYTPGLTVPEAFPGELEGGKRMMRHLFG